MALYYVLEKLSIVFSDKNEFVSLLIYPPKKIRQTFYKCDNRFHLDKIIEMYSSNEGYGITLISGNNFRCYLLEITSGNKFDPYVNYKLLYSDEIILQKKQKKGGSSANRIRNIGQNKRHLYVKKIAETIRKCYMRNNDSECIIKGLIIGGCGDIKLEVMDQDIFKQYFSKILLKVVTTEEISDSLIYKVYSSCSDVLNNFESNDVKHALNEFGDLLTKASDKLTFGNDIENNINNNNLKTLLIGNESYNNPNNKLLISKIKNSKCKVIVVPENKIENYNGIVGIKFY